MRFLKYLLLLLLLTNCNSYEETWETYTIEQGEFYANRPRKNLSSITGNKLSFKAVFDVSCISSTVFDDINKLYGFTDCNSSVHKNSLRFGWHQNPDSTIAVYAYWYTDGNRGFQKLINVSTGETHFYTLYVTKTDYVFEIDNTHTYSVPKTTNCEHGVRIRLFPYYGGNAPAPQRMVIHIYEL